jgi:hypothetical protein
LYRVPETVRDDVLKNGFITLWRFNDRREAKVKECLAKMNWRQQDIREACCSKAAK